MNINRKKLMYAILREANANSDIKYNAETFQVDPLVFSQVLQILSEEDMLKGILISKADNKTTAMVIGRLPRITLAGIEFIEENSNLSKVYKGLKEIREFLPF